MSTLITDYHANQSAAQSSWQEKNPSYWSNYRAKNPDYVEGNRQRERNRRRRGQDTDRPLIAKMDALLVEINVVSGG